MNSRFLLAALLLGCPAPACAHELKANRQVGALMHIQPDDSPKAGTQALAWFGLVRRGGEAVRLAQCECSLKVYPGKQASGSALVSPALREGKVEDDIGNKDRLLADLTFPKVGDYTLVLTGKPRAGGRFEPFTLRWVVQATP